MVGEESRSAGPGPSSPAGAFLSGRIRSTWAFLAVILLVAAAARFAALPQSREGNMTPDGARFLNLARSIRDGEGFVTPEACPAWLRPDSLPTPETFKEPGYPYAIAAAGSLAPNLFDAGQSVSLLAGLLIPLVTYALFRAMRLERSTATVAGIFAAASPLLIQQSVYLMADSLFALMIALSFLFSLTGRGGRTRLRAGPAALLAGAAFGLAFLVRAQAVFALPALVLALASGRGRGEAARALALAALAFLAVYSPYMVRNMRIFGVPFYSDVSAIGALPYMDVSAFTHSLERPPSGLSMALEHPGRILSHSLGGLRTFAFHILPGYILGHRVWLIPMAAGLVLALREIRRWGSVLLYGFLMLVSLLPLAWLPRYFTAFVPFAAGLTAVGLVRLFGLMNVLRPRARRPAAATAAVACVAILLLQTGRAVRGTPNTFTPELDGARKWGPWLEERLEPGEAVMAETTSYWSWYSERPSVYLVISGEDRFEEVVEELAVRWAALPLSRLEEYAALYPSGRLPAALVPFTEDPQRDIAIFRVELAP